MKNWENYIYFFVGAALGALGLLFMVLGSGCILGSFASILIALKKRVGYKAV
jgi:hypothetical protein